MRRRSTRGMIFFCIENSKIIPDPEFGIEYRSVECENYYLTRPFNVLAILCGSMTSVRYRWQMTVSESRRDYDDN